MASQYLSHPSQTIQAEFYTVSVLLQYLNAQYFMASESLTHLKQLAELYTVSVSTPNTSRPLSLSLSPISSNLVFNTQSTTAVLSGQHPSQTPHRALYCTTITVVSKHPILQGLSLSHSLTHPKHHTELYTVPLSLQYLNTQYFKASLSVSHPSQTIHAELYTDCISITVVSKHPLLQGPSLIHPKQCTQSSIQTKLYQYQYSMSRPDTSWPLSHPPQT